MSEDISVLSLFGKGIYVVISFFSGYTEEEVLSISRDFEILIIVSQVTIIWLIFRGVILYVMTKIWAFQKFETWKNVVLSLINFFSLLLIYLLFNVFEQKLRDSNTDTNINRNEKLVIIYSSGLVIWIIYYKLKQYEEIK